MDDKECCTSKGNARKAAQYLITIICVLIVGAIISSLPVMQEISFDSGLFAADFSAFAAKLAALVLFYLFSRHSIAALPDNGGTISFIRGIAVPTAALVIIVLGQRLVWQILEPFISPSGETVFFIVALLAILTATVWLMFCAYRDSLYLIDTLQHYVVHFPRIKTDHKTRSCNACGKTTPGDAEFCPYCGEHMEKPM